MRGDVPECGARVAFHQDWHEGEHACLFELLGDGAELVIHGARTNRRVELLVKTLDDLVELCTQPGLSIVIFMRWHDADDSSATIEFELINEQCSPAVHHLWMSIVTRVRRQD